MAATSAFQGLQTLNEFVGGIDVLLQIVGFNGSTAVPPLLQAFESLSISATLPALNSTLLKSAALTSPCSSYMRFFPDLPMDIKPLQRRIDHHEHQFNGDVTRAQPRRHPDLHELPCERKIDDYVTDARPEYEPRPSNYPYPSPLLNCPGRPEDGSNRCDRFTGRDSLQSDIILSSAVSISDYPTTLDFTQLAIPVATDDSLNLLLPILAQPIVQKIITGAVLATPQETAFVDAEIEFGAGLTISWQGQPLGSIAMPKVQVIGDIGAQLNLSASFHIADVGRLTSFTQALLTQEDFVHHHTRNYLTIQTTVTNVGVQLSSIGFNNFVGETLLGPAASSSGFTLAPQFIATFNLPLVGRLIHQDSASGLATVSQVFTGFIHGKSTVVTVVGNSAGPSDVSWLNSAIKSLQVSTVLPSQGPLQAINSNAATAAFHIPFAFRIDIVALEQNITVTSQGQSFAELVIPKGPSQTVMNTRVIHLTFSDVPFAVFSDKFAVFEQFLMQTTISSSETFELSGTANTDASTAIGTLSLTGINFDVSTTIAGLQGLNTKPAVVSNLEVNHGFSDFPLIKVTTTLTNPSNLTISMGDVAFTLMFEYV
ncbi:hypothetical protein JB92DRAFT_3147206 [Gautieria morchelliformis]|nr:hypothetical protein JB92DRAFT_3147206 [Gautieria morchelliformis]